MSSQERATPARHGRSTVETLVLSLPCLRASLAADVAPQDAEAADGVPQHADLPQVNVNVPKMKEAKDSEESGEVMPSSCKRRTPPPPPKVTDLN